jgi:hypothetical protein
MLEQGPTLELEESLVISNVGNSTFGRWTIKPRNSTNFRDRNGPRVAYLPSYDTSHVALISVITIMPRSLVHLCQLSPGQWKGRECGWTGLSVSSPLLPASTLDGIEV